MLQGPEIPVRDRLMEFLPLLLVGVVLLVFQLSRSSAPSTLPFEPLAAAAAPTPATTALGARAVPTRVPAPARATLVVALCNPTQPRFVGGMATLKAALGPSMGDPLECEHSVSDAGDTQQKTTTGLAYYRRQANVACFTTGWDHWGLLERGVVHWAGQAIDPPLDAAVITH